MARPQDNQDFLAQETRFGEILLNLSKGQEELRTLLTETSVRGNAEDGKLEHLQAEMDAMKAQMLGQRNIIHCLVQRQEELWFLFNQLLQGNLLGQTSEGKKPFIIQSSSRQEDKGKAPQMTPVPQIQHQPHQLQPDKPRRQFTPLNMSLYQALQRLLRLNLITLRAHPRNPNTASPAYDPNKRCAYHSASPGHDTNECWDLRNKIQDLIDEGAVEFTQDGQVEFFYHSSKAHQLK